MSHLSHKDVVSYKYMKNHITMTLRSKWTLYLEEETTILRTLLIPQGHKRNEKINSKLHRTKRKVKRKSYR